MEDNEVWSMESEMKRGWKRMRMTGQMVGSRG